MAHAYSHLFGIPATGLRFFTVYGPWGRPDMALFIFTKAILEGRPIDVYNGGMIQRDFTYVNDIIEGITRIIGQPPRPVKEPGTPLSGSTTAPYKIYNIGHSSPVPLMDFIEAIERKLGIEAQKNLLPMQPGDVAMTWADVSELQKDFGYLPATGIDEGIGFFLEWFQTYYPIRSKDHKHSHKHSKNRILPGSKVANHRKTSIHD
jgi:UDP-glucuronate 4-epimerase